MATTVEARELRVAPGIGISIRQQAWLLGVSGRWGFLILGLLAVLMLIGLSDVPPEVPRIVITANLALVGAVAWPIMVWLGEGPSRRSYHWSLPVPRPAHDLARVALGAVYLLGTCVVLAGASAIAASANGTFDRFAATGAVAWANFFVAPLIVYIWVSPVVLWSEYRITRWVFITWASVGPLSLILEWRGIHVLNEAVEWFFDRDWGITTALFDGVQREVMELPVRFEAWWTAAAMWFARGRALTVFTALYRPDDLRRLVHRT
ncbi:MAG: hypothetical protein ACE5PT_03990 [Gemmatimonadales bacterium]